MKINNLLAILAVLCPFSASAGELLKNWGLYNTEAKSHIDAPKAWALAKGGRVVKVCVVDTGVDIYHPDLKDRICPPIHGDEYGWDYVAGKKNPVDSIGHGTHVAGIIRATSPSACIIPVKWYSDSISVGERLQNSAKAIQYCLDRGAEVINYSGGGAELKAEKAAIEKANRKGVIFVAAAGNEGFYLSDQVNSAGYYPASYKLPNIIAVASLNIHGELLKSSDYGPAVQVAAPGENIYSTVPNERYAYNTGTSMAAPFVSGIAAMLLSKFKLTVPQLKVIIVESVNKQPNLKDAVTSGGKVNAFKAMVRAKQFTVRHLASKIR